MAALGIQIPFINFPDIDGQPLEDGFVYIGVAGMDAESNPITVYTDKTLTTPIAQPIRTLGGYARVSGNVSKLFVNAASYSIKLKNKNSTLIFSDSDASGTSPNADGINYTQGGTGSVQRTLESRLQDFISVKDWGATGDGVTDDRAAIQAAIDYMRNNNGGTIYFPRGKYILQDTALDLDGLRNTIFQGAGRNSSPSGGDGVVLKPTGTGHYVFDLSETPGAAGFLNLHFKDISIDSESGSPSTNGMGGFLMSTDTAYLFGMSFENVYVYALQLNGWDITRISSITFEDCYFDLCYTTGVRINTSRDLVFLNNQASGCGDNYHLTSCSFTKFMCGYSQSPIRSLGSKNGITISGGSDVCISNMGFESGSNNDHNNHILITGGAQRVQVEQCEFDLTSAVAMINVDNAINTVLSHMNLLTPGGTGVSLRIGASSTNTATLYCEPSTETDLSADGRSRISSNAGNLLLSSTKKAVMVGAALNLNGVGLYQGIDRTVTATSSGVVALTGGIIYNINLSAPENINTFTILGRGPVFLRFSNGNATIKNGTGNIFTDTGADITPVAADRAIMLSDNGTSCWFSLFK